MNYREPAIADLHHGAASRRPRTSESRKSGALPFVLGSMLLGTIGIFVHEANADPITATWFRCAFGLLGLTAWLAIRRDLSGLRPCGAGAAWMLSAAVLMVLAWTLFFAAIERTSAGVASVLFHVQPLWMLVLGAWLLKERVAGPRVFAVLLAMAGLVLATGILDGLALRTHSDAVALTADYWIGVLLCLFGALCTACVTLIAKRMGDTPAGVLAWWQCALGTLALLAWPITNGWPAWGSSWAWLSGLGLVHTALAYSLMYMGVGRLSTDRIAVLQFIYPALVIVIDWLFYGHRLGPFQITGIALMAAAIWYAERKPRG
jgi:drug/metabolite transporter (DMT)-like permease